MHEETNSHCLNPGCAHALPRPVAYCPYCGAAQSQALEDARRAAVGTAAASAAASLAGGWLDAPEAESMPAPPLLPARVTPAPAADAPPLEADIEGKDAAPVRPPVQAPAPDVAFGRNAHPQPVPPPPAPAVRAWGRGPAPPSGPRGRTPVRLRWWVLVLLVLWGVWYWAKLSSVRRMEARIDGAIALAHACKARDAQDELIALRATRATPQQLERLQQALNDEAAGCTRRKRRAGSHPLAVPER